MSHFDRTNEPGHDAEDRIDRILAENKRQLDRIEADGKRCLRILLGEDNPADGLMMRVMMLERHQVAQKANRSGVVRFLAHCLSGAAGAITTYIATAVKGTK